MPPFSIRYGAHLKFILALSVSAKKMMLDAISKEYSIQSLYSHSNTLNTFSQTTISILFLFYLLDIVERKDYQSINRNHVHPY